MSRNEHSCSVTLLGTLAAAALLVGCNIPLPDDEDANAVDMSLRRRDLGEARDLGTADDLGEPLDLGEPVEVDGGPPLSVGLRVAHLIPGGGGLPITLPIRLCVYSYLPPRTEPIATQTPTALPPAPAAPGSVTFLPFRAISGAYNSSLFTALDLTYRVRVYSAGASGIGFSDVACPAYSASTPRPIIERDVPGAAVTPGRSYTIAAIGLVPGTLGSTAPDLPAICGADLDTTCPSDGADSRAATLALIDDDISPPSAGNAKLRVLHGISNAPPLDVCYDPDGPAGVDPAPVAVNVSFGDASSYLQLPAPLVGGALSVHIAEATACAGTPIGLIPMPIPEGVIPAAFLAVGATNDVLDGDVITLFASGRSTPSGAPPTDPAAVSFIPWRDRPR